MARLSKTNPIEATKTPELQISSPALSVMLLSSTFEIISANQGTLDLLGYQEFELLGKPFASIIGQTRQGGSNHTLEDLLGKDGKSKKDVVYYEKSNRAISVSFSSIALKDAEGQTQIVCLAQPATDQSFPGVMGFGDRDFEIHSLIEDAISIFHPLIQKKQLDVAIEVSPKVPSVLEGNAQLLRQVLLHLIGNAVRFTDKGGVTITADLEDALELQNTSSNTLHLRLSVKDTGPGMSPDQVRAVTKWLHNENDTFGGVGLGFSACRRLTQFLGGKLWIHSLINKGTEVFLTAAVKTRSYNQISDVQMVDMMDELDEKEAIKEKAVASKSLRVSLVQSKAAADPNAERLLKSWGHRVQTIEPTVTTLDRCDLAVIDLTNNRAAAMDLVDQIRQQDQFAYRYTPIIGLVAEGESDNPQLAQLAGVDICVAKPVTASALTNAFEKASRQSPHWA